jgi:hypothetical protein
LVGLAVSARLDVERSLVGIDNGDVTTAMKGLQRDHSPILFTYRTRGRVVRK